MRLLPDQGAQDIQPVQVTYASEAHDPAHCRHCQLPTWPSSPGSLPMPRRCRRTTPTWEIEDEEIVFFTGGGNNYRQLLAERRRFNGQAFITEYAQPTSMSSTAVRCSGVRRPVTVTSPG